MTRHLKRYFAPKTWKIMRKERTYVTKPSPGTHKIALSLPLNVILRDMLNYAATNREVKFIVSNKNITVDGIRKKDCKFPVGLFDVLSLNDTNEHFRVLLDKKGKLDLIKIKKEESAIKLCKITGKKSVKGKLQLNLYDGKNILVEKKDFKVGDTILLVLGKKFEIKEHVKLDKNSLIYLTGGKHIGQIGKVQDIAGRKIIYKTEDDNVVETLKKYAFPVGKDKPLITLAK
ncbi:30S ribosomal protein S4e [Candidatus Woesearchaeota archaeon]|nr:30S ribosomal protein S4e [Candidatus Woesearchaeota archaeon]|tara:strand:- start:4493 stop:5185 length:693 start_codon:yes stop_codon:yes gene_type:complete